MSKRARLIINVVSHEGQPLSDATVTVETRSGLRVLSGTGEKGLFRLELPSVEKVRVTVQSEPLESEEREVHLRWGDNIETFILNLPGTRFFYRGKARVQFTPAEDRLAVVLTPAAADKARTPEAVKKALAKLAKAVGATVVDKGENFARNGMAVLSFPEPLSAEERERVAKAVAQDGKVAAAGSLLSEGDENATLLTASINARFEDALSADAVAEVAAACGLEVGDRFNALGNVYRLHSATAIGYSVLDTCEILDRQPSVVYAEPDLISTVDEDAFVPTDYLFPEQWDHQLIRTTEAWKTLRALNTNKTFGDAKVIIAVVDSGVDASHPEFSGNVTSGNPKIYQLFDFANMVANNNSRSSNHGTCCASAAAAAANNPSAVSGVNEGVAGVAGNCRVLGIRRSGSESLYAQMFLWAAGLDAGSTDPSFPAVITPGADIITNSYGGPGAGSPISQLMIDTFNTLTDDGRDGKGTLLFFSAGNAGNDLDTSFHRPWGMHPRTFSIAASTLANDGVTETQSAYTCWGSVIEVCAPSHDAYVGDAPLHNPTANYGAFTAMEVGDTSSSHATVGRPTHQTTLSATAGAGANTITVASTAGVAVGQAILIGAPGTAGTEGHKVTAVNAGTGVITLNRNLANAHPSGAAVATAQGDYLSNFGGTSHATPLAAGVAALMLSANPDLTWQEVRDILRETAVKIDPNNTNATGRWVDDGGRISTHPDYTGPLFSEFYGYGRVDAEAAVKRAGWRIEQVTQSLAFLDVPESETTLRAIRFDVQTLWETTFEIVAGPGSDFDTPLGASVTLPPSGDHDVVQEAYLWISYTGASTAPASAAGSVTIRCPQTEHEWTIPITANTVERPSACVMLCLDQSGSMDFPSGIGTSKRIDVLRFSANILVDVLHEGDGAGIVSFDHDPHDVLVPPVGPLAAPSVFDTDRNALKTAINTFSPNLAGLTAIGDGVERSQDRLLAVTGYGTKSVIVFTDGKETASQYIADVSGDIDDRVYAVGLGRAEAIEPAALTALTNGTGGYTLLTGDLGTDSTFKLAKYFLQILAGVKNEDIVVDPDGWVTPGNPHRIPYRVTETDISNDVILMGSTQLGLRLYLETPNGDIITPGATSTFPGSDFIVGKAVQAHRISLPAPIGPGARDGIWHAIVELGGKGVVKETTRLHQTYAYAGYTHAEGTSAGYAAAHGAQYSLLVHARSNLQLRCSLTQDSFEPGGILRLRAVLTEYGVPVAGRAAVRVSVVDPDGVASVQVLQESGPGVFEGAIQASRAGLYSCRFQAKGKTFAGREFTREAVRSGTVWHGGDRPFPTTPADPGRSDAQQLCDILYCLLSDEVLSRELQDRLAKQGINLDALRRCLEKACCPDRRSGSKGIIYAAELTRVYQYSEALTKAVSQLLKTD